MNLGQSERNFDTIFCLYSSFLCSFTQFSSFTIVLLCDLKATLQPCNESHQHI